MTIIKTNTYDSDRHAGNEGRMSFFPTPVSIVRMEMSLIDFSDLTGKDFKINVADLTGGVGDQLNETSLCIEEQGLKTTCLYNEYNIDRYNSCVETYPHMRHLNADVLSLKLGKKDGGKCVTGGIGVLRNNPPYGNDKNSFGVTSLKEVNFFKTQVDYVVSGGIHILEMPIGSVTKEFLLYINNRYHYEMFRFPDKEFKALRQVCIIMKRRKSTDKKSVDFLDLYKNLEEKLKDTESTHNLKGKNKSYLDSSVKNDKKSDAVKKAELYMKLINSENLIPLPDIQGRKIFKLEYADFKRHPEIHYFRSNACSDETLYEGGIQVWDDLFKQYQKNQVVLACTEHIKPIIEPLQGHVASLLASGRYNGIVGNLLVHGGSVKKVVETVEKNEEGVVEKKYKTEVLSPFIEFVNSEGDIYRVEY